MVARHMLLTMKASILVVMLPALLVLVLSACGGLTEAQQHSIAGVKLVEQEKWNEAIAEYDEAIRLDPKLAQAYYNRGNAYANLGQHQRAIQDYDEAIRLDPKLAPAYGNRAVAYTALRRDQEAESDIATVETLGFDSAKLKAFIEAAKKQR